MLSKFEIMACIVEQTPHCHGKSSLVCAAFLYIWTPLLDSTPLPLLHFLCFMCCNYCIEGLLDENLQTFYIECMNKPFSLKIFSGLQLKRINDKKLCGVGYIKVHSRPSRIDNANDVYFFN